MTMLDSRPDRRSQFLLPYFVLICSFSVAWLPQSSARAQETALPADVSDGQETELPMQAIWRFGDEPDANGIHRLAYSRDGKLLATRNRRNIVSIYDVTTRKRLCEVDGHENNWVVTIDFSPDSSFFLTSAGPSEKVKVWKSQTGKLESEIDTDGIAAYFNRGGTAIHVFGETHVETYSWPGVQLISQRKWKTSTDVRAGMSQDGRVVASYRRINRQVYRTQVVDLETKSKIQLDGPTGIPKPVAISPDGFWIAAAYRGDGKVRLWDLRDPHQKKYSLVQHDETVQSLSFSADSRFLLSSGYDKKVVLWDLLTRQEVAQFTGHTERVNATAFSPLDLTIASGASGNSDTSTIVWDLKRDLFQREDVDQSQSFDQVWIRLGANTLNDSLVATSQLILGGEEFLDLLEEQVETILKPKSTGAIDESVKLLNHPEWEVREKTTLQLLTIRAEADAELRLALEQATSPEIRCRLSRILKKKVTRPKSSVVDLRRWNRVVFALEQINTDRTQNILRQLGDNSADLDVALDARAAFERNQLRNETN